MKRNDEIHEASKLYVLNNFSNSVMQAFKTGARYADTTMLQKVLDWLIEESNNGTIELHDHEKFERRFLKAMKE